MANGIPQRAYQLMVGTEVHSFDGKASQSATSEDMLSFDNLQFTGNFDFDADNTHESSDDSVIEIYNLNPETRAAFHQHGATVMLRAGYDTDFLRNESGEIIPDYASLPVIYLGTVINALDKPVAGGVDRVTKVWLSTDKLERSTIDFSQAFAPGTKKADVIRDLVKRMGMPVLRLDIEHIGDISYPSGLSCFGSVASRLTKVCKENGLQWSVHNKTISVTRADNLVATQGNKDAEAWLLTPDQILNLEGYFDRQSSPDNVAKKKSHSSRSKPHKTKVLPEDVKVVKAGGVKTKTRQGVNVTTFLNGNIRIHDLVKIEGMTEYLPEDEKGRMSDGLYRVIKIGHDMDYLRGDWSTQLKLVPAV